MIKSFLNAISIISVVILLSGCIGQKSVDSNPTPIPMPAGAPEMEQPAVPPITKVVPENQASQSAKTQPAKLETLSDIDAELSAIDKDLNSLDDKEFEEDLSNIEAEKEVDLTPEF